MSDRCSMQAMVVCVAGGGKYLVIKYLYVICVFHVFRRDTFFIKYRFFRGSQNLLFRVTSPDFGKSVERNQKYDAAKL